MPVSFAEAALGTTILVPTIEGKPIEVSVPAGTQTGSVLKIKGRGMPVIGSSSRGNQLVTIRVNVPMKLSERQKELLKEFKQIEEENKTRKGFFKL